MMMMMMMLMMMVVVMMIMIQETQAGDSVMVALMTWSRYNNISYLRSKSD